MVHRLLIAALFAALLLSPASAAAVPNSAPAAPPDYAYFPETGHNVGGQFKRFYEANGGVDIFGLPLTELFVEDGLKVQYFERARFELHPDLPSGLQVALTRLGAYFTQGRTEPEFQWLSVSPSLDRVLFPESGHTIGGAIRTFWETRGGLAVFGYPVSEELVEISPTDGQSYTVQHFERARMEYHPEHAGTPYQVQLSHLGRQFLNERPAAQAMTAPAPRLTLLGQATTGFATSTDARLYNIERSAAMFDGVVVQPGQEYSFLNSGDFSADAGFVEGYGIVGGRLEKVIGGGLCQVSTTMFRAVSNAGLDITRRYGHTYVVYFYENILGFDATVFSPSVDFRWRNDSPGPVYLTTTTNANAATVTFQIWGTSDGRKVTYEGPFVKNVVKPSRVVWQQDPELPAGATRQLVHGRAGMDVNYIRTVKMPNGTIKHADDFATRYKPWDDFFAYGAGVKPPRGVTVLAPRQVTPTSTPAPVATPTAAGGQ
jgi:hypothetical protein